MHLDHSLHGTYDTFLVILSYLIAVAASYSALDLAGRENMSKGKNRLLWLIFGAISMGLGIWSMHFVGMLALTLPVKVLYHTELVIAGLLMAAGISGMHYT